MDTQCSFNYKTLQRQKKIELMLLKIINKSENKLKNFGYSTFSFKSKKRFWKIFSLTTNK